MVTRISTGASGIDTQSAVAGLMKARRIPLDQLKQKKQVIEWQRDDYRAVNTKLVDFRSKISNMRLQSTFIEKKVSLNVDNILSATGTANATEGVYKIKVNHLAQSAQITSNDVVTGADGDLSKTLTQLDSSFSSDTTLTIGGGKGTATITVKPTDTIADFVNKVNGESNYTGVKLSYDTALDRLFFVSSTTGATTSAVKLQTPNTRLLENVLKMKPADISSPATTGQTVTAGNKYLDGTIAKELVADQTFTINYGTQSREFTITKATSFGSLVNAINTSDLGVTAYFDSSGKLAVRNPDSSKIVSYSDGTSDAVDIVNKIFSPAAGVLQPGIVSRISSGLAADQNLKITYGPDSTTLAITNTTTLSDLIDRINSSDLGKKGLSAYMDDTGKLAFVKPDSGKALSFTDATADTTNIVNLMGLDSTTNSATYAYKQMSALGEDAEVVYNGVTAKYSTNTFSINGIQITAKKEDATEVNVTVSSDVDKVYESIKTFVDQYNEMIDFVNKKLQEKKDRNYKPLTDDQRKNMKDADIKMWEDKAKSGLIRSDSYLSGAMSKIRSALFTDVNMTAGGFKQLTQIGITTGDYTEQGKLHINEADLRKAIASNPDQVNRLFTADDLIDNSDSGDGFARRIYTNVSSVITGLLDKAGAGTGLSDNSVLTKETRRLDSSILDFNRRLTSIEDRYYKQFSAMETAIQRLNSQSTNMLQQLGSNK